MNMQTQDHKQAVPDPTQTSVAATLDTVGRIAHEINNPLDAAHRYINLAIRAIDEHQIDDASVHLSQASDAVKRVIEVSRNMLGHARKHAATHAGVPVNHIIEEALRVFEDQVSGTGVVISSHYRDGQVVTTHDTELFQICTNLIRNALDAMPTGGTLTITTVATNLDIAIRFEDTGPGFGDKITTAIEPFVSTKTESGGTGLGLAICRDLATALGGDIELADRRNSGASVTVRLPVDASKRQREFGASES